MSHLTYKKSFSQFQMRLTVRDTSECPLLPSKPGAVSLRAKRQWQGPAAWQRGASEPVVSPPHAGHGPSENGGLAVSLLVLHGSPGLSVPAWVRERPDTVQIATRAVGLGFCTSAPPPPRSLAGAEPLGLPSWKQGPALHPGSNGPGHLARFFQGRRGGQGVWVTDQRCAHSGP